MARMSDQRWLKENQKWFFPTICFALLTVLLGSLIVVCLFVFGMVKTSDVYKMSLSAAEKSPLVSEAIGSPLKGGFFVNGQINLSPPHGRANISIPLSGPNGQATIFSVAEKKEGKWIFSVLNVEIKSTGKVIRLSKEQNRRMKAKIKKIPH